MIIPFQPNNPTTKERYAMMSFALEAEDRIVDFPNIVELLNPPPDITNIAPPGSCKGIKIAVLGGGLAGLSTAFELRKLGFNTTLFEAQEERIGGRVYTHYFDKKKGLYGELGAMRFPVSHNVTWHYLNLFKLPTRPFVQTNENAFIYVRGVRVRNDPEGRNVQKYIYPLFDMTPEERRLSWQELESIAFERSLMAIPPEIRKEILQIKETYSRQINLADYYNIHQMMQESGLSDGSISMLSNVSPSIGAFFYRSFFEILAEIYGINFSFMYEIPGGMAKFPNAFLHSLLQPSPKDDYPHISPKDLGPVDLKMGHQIMGLSQCRGDNTVTVHYRRQGQPHIQHQDFDFVVCTLPFSSVRRLRLDPLFSSRKMQAIRILTYISAQKASFLFSERFWERGGPMERILGGSSVTDLPINSIWYPSDHAVMLRKKRDYYKKSYHDSYGCSWDLNSSVSPNVPGVLQASYNWGQDAVRLGNIPKPLNIYDITRQVEAVNGLYPGSLDPLLLDHRTVHWNTEPWFWGAFAFYSPSEHRLFSKVAITPEYNNRVFFAGEHVSVSRAWMQGSLQTGMMAANDVARACREIF
ncbi:monoamine oxidase [Natronincola peptidivorans]|uniref:Monoamine oxidase n=1 Tax=Natronincola peptidivorans TaxID=426128 RepID=A0A1H9Y5R1_9FIRM|nr:FAD-dependent oxidoreductase [Natronincola peptidivorans]SES64139.1 monoamine oxidase [Natronincola peptidivorans]